MVDRARTRPSRRSRAVAVACCGLVLAALATLAAAAAASGGPSFGTGTVTLRTGSRAVVVKVEVAQTRAQIERGLMHRRYLAPRSGMLFLFARDSRLGFWMKNTRIPLSIAFFDRRGRIVRMYDMAPCRSAPCPVYDPGRPIRGALEVNRGAFRRWRVSIGDRVTFALRR